MQSEFEAPDYSDAERALFSALPRELTTDADTEDRVVRALRDEGYFRRRRLSTAVRAAAAVLLFVSGAAAGAWYVSRNTLEAMVARQDISAAERIELVQRAERVYMAASKAHPSPANAQTPTVIWY